MREEKKIRNRVYKTNEKLPWTSILQPTEILEKFSSFLKENSIILDYWAWDWTFCGYFLNKWFKIVCSDISWTALKTLKSNFPQIQTIEASNPVIFHNKHMKFDWLFVWWVMHHVKKDLRKSFIQSFSKILKPNGIMLISWHSERDKEFRKWYRISPTTWLISHAINDIEKTLLDENFTIHKKWYYTFKEFKTWSERILKYFILKKQLNKNIEIL